jgi:transcription antitermination factor NusG
MMHQPALTPALAVGDVLPLDHLPDQRALNLAGSPRWHCLLVRPQAEAKCEAWLARHAVYAFHPVRARTITVRGATRRIESRYLPGYVFARFGGPVIWHRVLGGQFVTDAIRHEASRQPAALHPADLDALHAMRSVEDEAEARAANRRRAMRMFGQGDRVRVRSGLFAGHDGEVVCLGDERVSVRLRLLGRETDLSVGADDVDKL